ncbi:MAG TPA: MAE_28990/MAE_18760 family HEPN-like nuclease [Abditibacteriaceae bacterium]|jgi:hypothetical protein
MIVSLITVRSDFRARIDEVENYFCFVDELTSSRWMIEPDLARGGRAITTGEVDLFEKTLKANFFLLLYNMVEATAKSTIDAIYDEFRSKGVSYDDCRTEVQQIALKNLKRDKVSVETIGPKLNVIAQHILTEPFDKDECFSGNIDGRKLRSVAREYGFAEPGLRCGNLLLIKNHRNALAHGNKTFNEIGKDYEATELKDVKDEVIKFLEKFIDNVETYLASELYLKVPPSPPPSSTPAVAAT